MTSEAVNRVLAKLPDAKRNGNGWVARCPAHDDHDPSLCIDEGKNGRCLLHCQAECPLQSILAKLGLEQRDLFVDGHSRQKRSGFVAIHDYREADGTLRYQVCRTLDKQFPQRRPMPDGSWAWGLSAGLYVKGKDGDYRKVKRGQSTEGAIELPECPRILYRLPELLAADPDEIVFVCEGEKDADALAALGLVATCNPGGAGKWRHVDNEPLRDRHVVVVPDIDDAGRKHAKDVNHRLRKNAATVRVLWLPMPEGHDAYDFILDRQDDAKDDEAIRTEIQALAEQAPEGADEPAESPKGQSGPSGELEAPRLTLICGKSIQRQEIEWIWPRRLAAGKLNLIVSEPNYGKTYLALDISARVTAGLPWPDLPDVPNPPGDVLFASLEDDPADTLLPRFDRQQGDDSRFWIMKGVEAVDGSGAQVFDMAADLRHLEERLRDLPKA
jgi:hypothetical protein